MSSRAGFLCVAAIVAVAQSSFAQITPAAAPSAASTPAKTKSAPAPVATLKAAAQLVVVDVVVTDNGQRPIHGLKASDFTLSESGIPQVIKNFEEHTALTTADATKLGPMPTLPPGIFTNYNPAPANGAVNLILLDTLNTPMRDQSYVRQQLLAYLKATPPGARIAIFGLTTHLIMLQGFTSDPELLRRVLEKTTAGASPILKDQVGGGGIQDSEADKVEDMNIPGSEQMIENMREFDARQQTFQIEVRAKLTLDAMNQIARYASGIRGRKNLIWFSGSFPLNVLPDTNPGTPGTVHDPFAAMGDSQDEFRGTVALLGRSQIAVYPVDARGLMTSPVMQASTGRNYGGARGIERMKEDNDQFFNDTVEEHGTMREMANATGGQAFVNTNGLKEAVAKAVTEGANFYTLTYTPTNTERDGKLRKIRVEVARPGVQLAYRRGYYADDPAKVTKADYATTAAAAPSTRDTLRLAMTRGAPTPGEILIKVGVVPMTPATQTEDKVAPGNSPTAKANGPFRRYSVNYAINAADLSFLRQADGKISAEFDLVIFVFNANGDLINLLKNTAHLGGSLDEIRKSIVQGVLCHQEISAPAKGEYFLRIAVHDLHRDHYGAVEVATADVKNLKPAVRPPAADPAGAAK
jgi:VWFA-related protein